MHLLNTLYVTQPESYLRLENKTLRIEIERELRLKGESEVSSREIGELVMQHLEKTDQIAYVRFASVYRQFADVQNFMQELQRLVRDNDKAAKAGKGESPAKTEKA